MLSVPKIFKRKKKSEDLLIIEIGLERINCAVFKKEGSSLKLVGIGRKKFLSREDIFNSTIEALDSLAAIVPDLPVEAILGVSGGLMETITTIARYSRPNKKSKINIKETEEAINQVVKKLDTKDKKIFFTTVGSAKIDGVKVTNPIGLKGENLELSCFVAFKPPFEVDLLERIIDETDLKVDKILPTSFAVSKLFGKENIENALIFRAGMEKSELTILEDGYLSEIIPVDIGALNDQYLIFALKAAFKDIKEENLPALVWLFADNDGLDFPKLKEFLLSIDWNKEFKLPVRPKIETAENIGSFSASDMGLYALSREVIVE